jgi:hypothetical protein
MIAVPAGVKVLIAAKPVDFRKGGDGLAALVREALIRAPDLPQKTRGPHDKPAISVPYDNFHGIGRLVVVP